MLDDNDKKDELLRPTLDRLHELLVSKTEDVTKKVKPQAVKDSYEALDFFILGSKQERFLLTSDQPMREQFFEILAALRINTIGMSVDIALSFSTLLGSLERMGQNDLVNTIMSQGNGYYWQLLENGDTSTQAHAATILHRLRITGFFDGKEKALLDIQHTLFKLKTISPLPDFLREQLRLMNFDFRNRKLDAGDITVAIRRIQSMLACPQDLERLLRQLEEGEELDITTLSSKAVDLSAGAETVFVNDLVLLDDCDITNMANLSQDDSSRGSDYEGDKHSLDDDEQLAQQHKLRTLLAAFRHLYTVLLKVRTACDRLEIQEHKATRGDDDFVYGGLYEDVILATRPTVLAQLNKIMRACGDGALDVRVHKSFLTLIRLLDGDRLQTTNKSLCFSNLCETLIENQQYDLLMRMMSVGKKNIVWKDVIQHQHALASRLAETLYDAKKIDATLRFSIHRAIQTGNIQDSRVKNAEMRQKAENIRERQAVSTTKAFKLLVGLPKLMGTDGRAKEAPVVAAALDAEPVKKTKFSPFGRRPKK